jgi:tetratricopeptide (TPR) repeat protein
VAAKDHDGALADFDQALKINPRYWPAWKNRAHVLAEKGHNREALAAMDEVVALEPGHATSLVDRGVLLARLGRRREAHEAARAALDRDASPLTLYQAAAVYSLTSLEQAGDRLEAFPLLARALAGGFGLEVIDKDHDMDPIRKTADFRRIVRAAKDLRSGGKDDR